MVLRKFNFKNKEYYHIANHSIDKLILFRDKDDFLTFLKMMDFFNTKDSLGSSIKYQKAKKDKNFKKIKIVEIISYALINNHFHLLLQQKEDGGIIKFMQKLSTGYAMYFNKKYKRRGSLFVSRFRSEEIRGDEELKKVAVYINLNFQIHKMKVESFKLISSEVLNKIQYFSSQEEYLSKNKFSICNKKVVMGNDSVRKYKSYSESAILDIIETKEKFLEY